MKKNGLKRILIILSVLLLVGATAVGVMFATESSLEGKEDVSLKIAATNLSFSDSIYIKYAVDRGGVKDEDVTLLIWTEANKDGKYVKGTETSVLSYVAVDEIKDSSGNVIGEYLIFNYSDLAAKQMTDVVYARAYAKVDGKEYYSEPKKYSILQYAYNKLGKTGEGTNDEELVTLLEKMLNYGALAQTYKNYKTDTLATDNFSQVKIVGGVHTDGFTHGLYKVGTTVTISAPETDDGFVFAGWKNSAGQITLTDAIASVVVGETNETYTAIYQGITSNNLKYIVNDDGVTCSVWSVGSCTDQNIVIPSVVNGKIVTGICEGAFKDCQTILSVEFSKNIASIGAEAFSGCTNLNAIRFSGSEYEWTNVEKAEGWDTGAGDYTVYYGVKNEDWELEGDQIG